MSLEDNHKYSQLRLLKPEYDGFSSDERIDSSSASENDLIEKNQPSELQPRRKYSILALIVANVVLCMVSIAMLSVGLRLQANGARRCLSLHSTPSPALGEIDPIYRPVKFNGTLDYPSIYRGRPSLELDEAWDALENVRIMSISENDVLKAGKTTDAIRIPEEFGGGFMASVEVNHQLHCVNFLRKSLHREYYANRSLEFTDKPATVEIHLGHCVEMLRQFVMCHADVGVMTHRWVKDYPHPYPDFSTWHQCRNFENVLAWTKEKQMRGPPEGQGAPESHKWHPLLGEMILDSPP